MNDDTGHQSIRALANERRRGLMELLREGEKSVNDLAARFDVARPAISRHLRVLREAGLVRYRSDHNVRYYSLRQPEIERLRETVDEVFRVFWSPQGLGHDAKAIAGVESSYQIFHQVRVSTLLPIERDLAFRYCTERTLFREWVGGDADAQAEVGGKFRAVSAFGGQLEGEFLAFDRPGLILNRITSPIPAEENIYTIGFETAGDKTRMELVHYLADENIAKFVRGVWGETLALLRTKLKDKFG